MNVVTNAFYAVGDKARTGSETPEGLQYEPAVSVSTKKQNGQVRITVTDNGNGIPENVKEKIFQPFFTTKPTGQGTGLGLSLAYDILHAHGGTLQAESVFGQGSIFTIALPA